jgi:hypothetical protein
MHLMWKDKLCGLATNSKPELEAPIVDLDFIAISRAWSPQWTAQL